MSSVLEYPKFGLKFYCICPKSSGTIEKQNTEYSPYGVSVVALLEKEQKIKFNQIIESIEKLGYHFTRIQDLHFTLLSLFDDKRKQNPYYLQLTCDAIKKFLSEYNHKVGSLKIECDIVRPALCIKTRKRFHC